MVPVSVRSALVGHHIGAALDGDGTLVQEDGILGHYRERSAGSTAVVAVPQCDVAFVDDGPLTDTFLVYEADPGAGVGEDVHVVRYRDALGGEDG